MNIFKYITKSLADFKWLILGMLICILLIAVDGNLRPYIIKLIIDQAADFNLSRFIKLSSIFILSQVMMVIANAIFDWLGTLFHTRYRSYTLHKFFDKISSYKYNFFENTQSGAITIVI